MPLHLQLLFPLIVLALGQGLGGVQVTALLAGVAYAGWVFADRQLPVQLWLPVTLLSSVALAAHLVPGFSPLPLGEPQRLSPDAPPYALRVSWDKLLVGMTLLAWWLGRPTPRALAPAPRNAWLAALATLLLVPLLALAIGLVGWQPKWPEMIWEWLAVNLLVTVLAEELVFRGLLQPVLVCRLGARDGVLLTAAIFGAVHLPFSPLFALVAGLAGLGYGLAFHYSGRLSMAVALHLAVNACHLMLLSYPLRLA
ncbi:CPBP family intramembrane metalloprotease [Pseudomonas sp. JM0905a]|uniref:CPBP family intramembrane glutamic endopeptidase n=1 Tax=Pseudomonas sp. JM0905a TaxID=2772484 RepID=UPI001684925F|nr:CPBP family intramembrane glutamic endopeptidase [Pseudomonas sp. JM0905a]MBD2837405.1 CPBP family intramembrane metalloprotease [Pseudomonas sp. JM0905a]